MDINTRYIKYAKNITREGYKLICIPYAGGGASCYIRWQQQFGDAIQVLPIQLPGHETRLSEPPLYSCRQAAEEIAEAVLPYIEHSRFAVFGHSMGGIIAFETVLQLQQAGLESDVLFESATSIEDYSGLIRSRTLNEKDFMERISIYGALDSDSEIMQIPEYHDMILEILRADFSIVEDYQWDGSLIRCPIVAMCGTDDGSETIENMHSWRNYTESLTEFRSYPGGHFYLSENTRQLCGDINKYIQKFYCSRLSCVK